MSNDNNEDIVDLEQNNEQAEDIEVETEDVEEVQEERVETPKETPEARVARLTRQLDKAREKAGIKTEKKSAPIAKTGDLDETQLDYLDLKGISESEDVSLVEGIVKKTGMTVRQALKDEYVQAKLIANKASREVKSATPSATRRGGNQTNDIASALAKFEQTGELPDDYTLRSAVVNAKVSSSNTNKPSWH